MPWSPRSDADPWKSDHLVSPTRTAHRSLDQSGEARNRLLMRRSRPSHSIRFGRTRGSSGISQDGCENVQIPSRACSGPTPVDLTCGDSLRFRAVAAEVAGPHRLAPAASRQTCLCGVHPGLCLRGPVDVSRRNVGPWRTSVCERTAVYPVLRDFLPGRAQERAC